METKPSIPRRTFLTQACGLGLGSLAYLASPQLPSLFGSETGPGGPLDLAKATCALFRPHVGSTFRLQMESGKGATVELVRAEELPERKPHGGRVQHVPQRPAFSLVFRGKEGAGLPQETVRVEHERLGQFALLVVPVGAGADQRMRYEAIFN